MKKILISISLISMLSLWFTATTMATSFEDAVSSYDQHIDAIAVAAEKAAATGDMFDIQDYELELDSALDNMGSVVVESCYSDWHRAVMVRLEMFALAQRFYRWEMADISTELAIGANAIRYLIVDEEIVAEEGCKDD